MNYRNRSFSTWLRALAFLFVAAPIQASAADTPKKQPDSLTGKWAFERSNLGNAACRSIDAKFSRLLLSNYFCKEGWVASADDEVLASCVERSGRNEFLVFASKKDCEMVVDRTFRNLTEGDDYY